MLKSFIRRFSYGKNNVVLESGFIARQANAAVMVSMDDTTVLVTVVGDSEKKPEQDFFPLFVNYQERTYAAGRFPGGFFRREGRPSEGEVLTSRLIDRPIRPLFPEGFLNEVQVIATVISVNPQINPDIVAIIGVSAALSISDIPFFGPIGVARVGFIDDQYVLNPTVDQLVESRLDLVVSGTSDAILMVESSANLLNEKEMLEAIMFGHEQQQVLIQNINEFVNDIGQSKWQNVLPTSFIYGDEVLCNRIRDLSIPRFCEAYLILDKKQRRFELDLIKKDVISLIQDSNDITDVNVIMNFLNYLEKQVLRKRILQGEPRIDGRSKDMVRTLDMRIGVLPRTHGSALFTRGDTQALVTVTLGTERNAQNIDELIGERTDRFLLHYNFLPYCVGEIGMVGAPKRREIGHGRLAKRGVLAVMPDLQEFPYTIRVVSEITESNGSSSMASICGASLALMDAGVPIKSAVSGIAMGLIKEGNDFVVLSDIMSDEDYIGDMDFKVSGSRYGITALQMDIKIRGITHDIIYEVLKQAKIGRLHILNLMDKVIHTHRCDISEFAPRIHVIQINPEKIKYVIGKGGSVIRVLTEETGTDIEVEDNGIIKISAVDSERVFHAIRRIKEITADIEVGCVYKGKVTHIVDFGAFVNICGNKEGLVHISHISERRINKVIDYLQIGQEVLVKVLDIDRLGRIRLSIKDVS